jgi:hypothetical protein
MYMCVCVCIIMMIIHHLKDLKGMFHHVEVT